MVPSGLCWYQNLKCQHIIISIIWRQNGTKIPLARPALAEISSPMLDTQDVQTAWIKSQPFGCLSQPNMSSNAFEVLSSMLLIKLLFFMSSQIRDLMNTLIPHIAFQEWGSLMMRNDNCWGDGFTFTHIITFIIQKRKYLLGTLISKKAALMWFV